MKSILVLCILCNLWIAGHTAGGITPTSTSTTTTTVPSSSDTPSSTTKQPTPSPIPDIKPETLSFNITGDDKTVCALFSFVATFDVKDLINGTEHVKRHDALTAETTVASGSCDENSTSLVLNINGRKDETLTLHLDHAGSAYALSKIEITLGKDVFSTEKSVFSNVEDGKSYYCNSNPEIQLTANATPIKNTDKIYLLLKDLKVDAFRKKDDGNEYRQSSQCESDFPTNDFVPLAVGCALISLVFIVLIAYIVGRKRSRRLTYQSV